MPTGPPPPERKYISYIESEVVIPEEILIKVLR